MSPSYESASSKSGIVWIKGSLIQLSSNGVRALQHVSRLKADILNIIYDFRHVVYVFVNVKNQIANKSVDICESYNKKQFGSIFYASRCRVLVYRVRQKK